MSIVFSWLNPNKEDITSIDVYRAETLGGQKTKLATVSPGALGYEDTTADVNRVYYYSTVVFAGSLSTPSIEIPLASFENTGPGPQTLLRGDWNYGFFGTVPKNDPGLPTFAEMATKVGIAYQSYPDGQFSAWFKCVVRGRILFIPNAWLYEYGFNPSNNMGPGKAMMAPGGKESDCLQIKKGTNAFYMRPPFTNNLEAGRNFNNVSPNIDPAYPFFGSEVCMLVSLFQQAAPTNVNLLTKYKFNDNPTAGFTGNASSYYVTNSFKSDGTTDSIHIGLLLRGYGGYSYANYTYNCGYQPVLVLNLD